MTVTRLFGGKTNGTDSVLTLCADLVGALVGDLQVLASKLPILFVRLLHEIGACVRPFSQVDLSEPAAPTQKRFQTVGWAPGTCGEILVYS